VVAAALIDALTPEQVALAVSPGLRVGEMGEAQG